MSRVKKMSLHFFKNLQNEKILKILKKFNLKVYWTGAALAGEPDAKFELFKAWQKFKLWQIFQKHFKNISKTFQKL